MWPTWQQAAIAAAILLCIALATRGRSFRGSTFTSAFCGETALVAALYAVWQAAHALPLVHNEGAYTRAQQIWDLQQTLHLPSELTMQQQVMPHRYLAEACNVFYATVHVPALLLFLLWLFVRHRDQYGHWRNSLAILTAFCLFIRFVRVAPPRLMPQLGFVDLSGVYGQSLYGPVGTGISDQFAAMPSIHVGWAAIVGLGIVMVSDSKWRWFFLAHPIVTMWVVMVTGNHWWMDGLVAIALLLVAMLIDTGDRKVIDRYRPKKTIDLISDAPAPVVEPEPELVPAEPEPV